MPNIWNVIQRQRGSFIERAELNDASISTDAFKLFLGGRNKFVPFVLHELSHDSVINRVTITHRCKQGCWTVLTCVPGLTRVMVRRANARQNRAACHCSYISVTDCYPNPGNILVASLSSIGVLHDISLTARAWGCGRRWRCYRMSQGGPLCYVLASRTEQRCLFVELTRSINSSSCIHSLRCSR